MSSSTDSVNRRILVIDDNAAIHEDFQKILCGGPDIGTGLLDAERILFGHVEAADTRPTYQIDYALQGQHGLSRVERAVAEGQRYSVVFVDMRMPPGWDGLETIEHLWKADADLQIVICSAYSDYEWADVVGRVSHSDKLLILKKPFEPIEVLQCASAMTHKWQQEQAQRQHVEALERIVTARTEGLEAANRQLRHLATHDALTGLPNRILLDDRLTRAIAHANLDGHQFAVLALNLDRFQLINDSLGHRAGDALLRDIGRRLAPVVRSIDTIARTGGNEFVLVIDPITANAEAEQVARRAIAAIQEPIQLSGIDVRTTTSIGISFYPTDGTSAETLLARADAAMYCAKQRGRNNQQCFASGMEVTRESVKLESALHDAVRLQQLELHYQPKADVITNNVHSAEALVRWRHPEKGMILPGQFIPLAEECGLIIAIGEWVIRNACRQCKAWHTDGLPPLRVAVNVAAAQFRHGNLLDVIRHALEDAKLEPQYLELELTESAVMINPEESAEILENLSRMGVVVSVDDFGTGYSNMSYLRRFPIDKLKIDRSFITDLMVRNDDASIVRAIISLAHGLQLQVIAEGVETAEQLAFLRSMGCDQYQGYYFSPPLPDAAFRDLARSWPTAESSFSEDVAARTHSKLAFR